MSVHERERLSAYLDGELAPEERAAVEAHVRGCVECAASLAEMGAVDQSFRDLPAEAPPGYFETLPSRVRVRLEAQGAGRGRRVAVAPLRRIHLPVWTWAVAAALVLAVVAPLTLKRARPLPTSPSPAAEAVAPRAEAPAEGSLPPRAAEPPARRAKPLPSPPAASANTASPVGAARPGAGKSRNVTRDLALDRPAPGAPPAAPLPPAPTVAEQSAAATRGAEPQATFAPAPEVPAAAADAVAAKEEGDVRSLGARSKVVAGPAAGGARPAMQAAREGGPSEAKSADAEADRMFARLSTVRPASVDGWRRHREAWRRFLKDHPTSPYTDAAWVEMIEAGFQVRMASGQADDAATFTTDAAAYLSWPGARQKERVRALVAEASRMP
jgi:hypothetical protein